MSNPAPSLTGAAKRFLASAATAPLWLIAAAVLLPFGLLLLLFMRGKPAPEEAGSDPIPGAPPEPGETPAVAP